MVERQLPKLKVAGSRPVSRSTIFALHHANYSQPSKSHLFDIFHSVASSAAELDEILAGSPELQRMGTEFYRAIEEAKRKRQGGNGNG